MVMSPTIPTKTNTENKEAFAQEDCSKHQHHLTPGKKAHWALTYLGGDWLMNSTFGVAFAYWASRTHTGQEIYYKNVTKFFTKLASPLIKNPDTLEKVVGGGTSFLNIMFGGTVINPVLTYLESHEKKKAISKSFDELIYGKERVATDPKFQQAYDEIDHEAKKGNKSVWAARFIALAPLIYASSNPKVNAFFKSNEVPVLKWINFDHISKFSQKTAEKLGILPQKMMAKTSVNKMTGEEISNWKALHDLIGFDFGYTIYYALIHSAAFSFVAKVFETNHERREERRAERAAERVSAAPALSEKPPLQQSTISNPGIEPKTEKPQTSISHVAEHARTVAVEQTAQLA